MLQKQNLFSHCKSYCSKIKFHLGMVWSHHRNSPMTNSKVRTTFLVPIIDSGSERVDTLWSLLYNSKNSKFLLLHACASNCSCSQWWCWSECSRMSIVQPQWIVMLLFYYMHCGSCNVLAVSDDKCMILKNNSNAHVYSVSSDDGSFYFLGGVWANFSESQDFFVIFIRLWRNFFSRLIHVLTGSK